jgi:hypothetical protein
MRGMPERERRFLSGMPEWAYLIASNLIKCQKFLPKIRPFPNRLIFIGSQTFLNRSGVSNFRNGVSKIRNAAFDGRNPASFSRLSKFFGKWRKTNFCRLFRK